MVLLLILPDNLVDTKKREIKYTANYVQLKTHAWIKEIERIQTGVNGGANVKMSS